jgi:prepilin-type N-terminal cleavage/methylation domain-containing protein
MFTKNRGFTLIELLVVISIIGVLSSTSLVAFQGVKQKAKDTKFIVEIKELTKALELYRLDNGVYPGVADTYYVSSPGAGSSCADGTGLPWTNVFDQSFRDKYLSRMPDEIQSCGIVYIRFSGTVEKNIGCFEIPPTSGSLQHSSNFGYGYQLAVMVSDPNKYTYLPTAFWKVAAGNSFTTNQKCILGPMR